MKSPQSRARDWPSYNKLLNFTFKTEIAMLNSELAEKFPCIKRGHSLSLKDCPRPMTAIQCRCEQFQRNMAILVPLLNSVLLALAISFSCSKSISDIAYIAFINVNSAGCIRAAKM